MAYQQPTARDLIIQAMRIAGIVSTIEVPSAEETSFALSQLNDMLDQLRLDEDFPEGVQVVYFDVTPPKIKYTVGRADPDPLAVQPDIITPNDVVRIDNMEVLLGGKTWQPLRQVSTQDYFRSTQTPSAGRIPNAFAYNRQFPYSEILLWAEPSQGYPMRMTIATEIRAASLDQPLDLPSGYSSAIVYGLASNLAGVYGLLESLPRLDETYTSRLARVKRLNGAPPLLSTVPRSMYNIYADSYTSSGPTTGM